MHDPRVGRFFAVDPLTHQYPWYSPYQFSGNKVIAYGELEGLEEAYRVVPLQTNKPVFRTDVNVSVLDRFGNAVSNTLNFVANNTAGVAINTSADVAEVIAGKKNIRLWDDIINPVQELVHEAYNYHTSTPLNQQIKDTKEALTTLDTYSATFQMIVARKLPKIPTGKVTTKLSLVNKPILYDKFRYFSKNFQIGYKTLNKVTKHLEQFGYRAENSVMLERMEKIAKGAMKPTDIDVNFAKHELRENALMKKGMSQAKAHEQTLKEQGMYHPEYEKKLYTKEAIDAGDAQSIKETKIR